MSQIKMLGASVFAGGAISKQDWIAIIGILIMVLSMIQEYLKERSS